MRQKFHGKFWNLYWWNSRWKLNPKSKKTLPVPFNDAKKQHIFHVLWGRSQVSLFFASMVSPVYYLLLLFHMYLNWWFLFSVSQSWNKSLILFVPNVAFKILFQGKVCYGFNSQCSMWLVHPYILNNTIWELSSGVISLPAMFKQLHCIKKQCKVIFFF